MENIIVKIDPEKEKENFSDIQQLVVSSEIIINNQDDFNQVNIMLEQVKKKYKELEEQRKKITKPIDDAKKAVMDLFNQPLSLLKKSEEIMKNAILKYVSKKEEEARKEQEKLREIAEREAEKERKKLEAKIEKAKEKGLEEKVEQLEEQIENITPVVPIVAPEIEKVNGISFRENWFAEVVDFDILPNEYKIPNMKLLDSIAKATKGTQKIPGIIFKSEKIVIKKG